MKRFLKKDRRSDLQKEMDRVLAQLDKMDPLSDEYDKLLGRWCRLADEKVKLKPYRPSVDTIINSGVTIGGLWMILHHEQLHVITSKGLQLITGRFRRS